MNIQNLVTIKCKDITLSINLCLSNLRIFNTKFPFTKANCTINFFSYLCTYSPPTDMEIGEQFKTLG